MFAMFNQSTDWSKERKRQRNANNHDHWAFNHLWRERWQRLQGAETVCGVELRSVPH